MGSTRDSGSLAECGGLRLHPDKTPIVYCQDGKRRGSHEHRRFTFLGFTFRSRRVRTRTEEYSFGFNPAVSDEAGKRIRRQIRFWRLHLRSGSSLGDLAREANPIVRGWVSYWVSYCGRFYKSELIYVLKGINRHLMCWVTEKFMSRHGSDGGWRCASAPGRGWRARRRRRSAMAAAGRAYGSARP